MTKILPANSFATPPIEDLENSKITGKGAGLFSGARNDRSRILRLQEGTGTKPLRLRCGRDAEAVALPKLPGQSLRPLSQKAQAPGRGAPAMDRSDPHGQLGGEFCVDRVRSDLLGGLRRNLLGCRQGCRDRIPQNDIAQEPPVFDCGYPLGRAFAGRQNLSSQSRRIPKPLTDPESKTTSQTFSQRESASCRSLNKFSHVNPGIDILFSVINSQWP